MGQLNSQWKECRDCGDEFPIERWALGYRHCMFCGEDQARAERSNWTIIQEYGKGGYMYVSQESARTTLLDTNPKNPRS